jgi:tRNA threonylcarbamoyladenosine biosynthesis protein TsaE
MSQSQALELTAPDPESTLAIGSRLAKLLEPHLSAPLVIGLSGELGSGKTTLARGFLTALGVTGPIRSPTYTLLEEYDAGPLHVAHLDLYRVRSQLEIEELGIRDLLEADRVLLIEWPERWVAVLPQVDLTIALEFAGSGRLIRLVPHTAAAQALVAALGGYSGRRSG